MTLEAISRHARVTLEAISGHARGEGRCGELLQSGGEVGGGDVKGKEERRVEVRGGEWG